MITRGLRKKKNVYSTHYNYRTHIVHFDRLPVFSIIIIFADKDDTNRKRLRTTD